MNNFHCRGRKVWGRYVTRKDFYHKYEGHFLSYYKKKPYRIDANRCFRRYKGDVANGNWYRKVYDVMYRVV